MKFLRKVTDNDAVKALGPGLITGAADDDPSGIATYSQAGAQFGFNMLWTLVLTYPLMVGIQLVSARIGLVTGRGLAANIRRAYPPVLLYAIVLLLLVANIINIAADVAAMGEALHLVAGFGSAHLYSLGFGFLCLTLQLYLPYRTYVRFLKWLTLALLAYVATVFAIHLDWADVARATIGPHFAWNRESVALIVAVFGTTISPYLFFWQASQEVEELRDSSASSLRRAPTYAARHLRRIKLDTFIGMAFSNIVAFFIMLTAAGTLAVHGITDIQSSAQAAEALRPIAGEAAFIIFALGIIGTGMLAIPVLAGSAAYAVTESFRWRSGLDRTVLEAREFYAIISLATIGGVALNFAPVDPVQALIWSAQLNGVIAVPIMIVMMLLASNENVMGKFTLTRRHALFGWLGVAVMVVAVTAMFASA
ncbi:NRAMP (natural resistance-associated macrophage protein)-like metal ion transporter [Pseudoduganella flava]|uniref:Divalent metal cation transporter n=1 Tax=Pseudoduganella flava TaxID=871742 RepID=A0A562PW35_9BURK|nr:Nramp family divalent metal transporter [Pseudoduganella flava]QGZ39674.1 divalent metal cation transporter [Pseudoduganella flava]TWI48583.1 NRAMP (natural resistance-associated macrophage protein)-like metal ion transporter [Pseudoduganella flava]